jgi:hypothetical protein
MNDSSGTPKPSAGSQILRCPKCGKTAQVTQADLLRYTRTHWPTCCGEVMALLAQNDKPPNPQS